MLFKSYTEIDNVETNKILDKIIENNFNSSNIIYRCSEKVDGSNFSIWIYPNNIIKYARRSDFLNEFDSFMGYERAIRNDDLNNKAILIRNELLSRHIILDSHIVVIYGELYGGYYNHPDVKKIAEAIKVQKRIDYAPDNHFYAFDILIQDEENNKNRYLDDNLVIELCDKVSMNREIILFEGTLDECLKYPNDEISKIGTKLHNLPIIENNIEEGIVIKPIFPLFFPNGKRVILKNKNSKFKERMKRKENSSKKSSNKNITLSKEEEKYLNILQEYITKSRLYSVTSKIGTISDKDFGKVLGLFIKDILNDFNKEYGDEISLLEKNTLIDEFNFKKIKVELQKIITEWIRPYFIELL